MSEIEWQDGPTYTPSLLSIKAFRRAINLPATGQASPCVYIAQAALEGLNDYLASDTTREQGGVLAGLPFTDPDTGQTYVDIRAAIPALDTTGSPVHLQFTANAWAHISGILEENFTDLVILGWYHSHPGLGVFMSGTDQSTHRSFYSQPWNLALVVDPMQGSSAWFIGPECRLLAASDVQVYPPLREEIRAPAGRRASNLAWLLPLALLFIAFVFTIKLLLVPSNQ